jgi:cysteine desulfurase/selenocysteine lyase
MEPLQAYDVALLLDKKGFALRSGRHCADLLHARLGLTGSVRLSPAFYNTREEIDRLGEALEEIAEVARKAGIPMGERTHG